MILSVACLPARRGAPFEPLLFVTDNQIHLDRSFHFPPVVQPVDRNDSCSRRPVEAACGSDIASDALDRGRRPFWSQVRRDNRVDDAADLRAPAPACDDTPARLRCGHDESRTDPCTYRVERKVVDRDASKPQPSPQPSQSPHAPQQSARRSQGGPASQHHAPAKSVLEITIERVIVSGRLIDLVI